MSFGPSNTTKTAENNIGGISNTLTGTQYPLLTGTGTNLFSQGGPDIQSGTNFLNTVLSGNNANTTAALQPNIDQIRQGTSNTLTAANTLMPRGGGRSGTLFSQAFAPQAQIQSLFNNARTGAATALPQIGLAQEGLGTNLLTSGTGALTGAGGLNANLGGLGQNQQQITNQLLAGLGGGLFNLAAVSRLLQTP